MINVAKFRKAPYGYKFIDGIAFIKLRVKAETLDTFLTTVSEHTLHVEYNKKRTHGHLGAKVPVNSQLYKQIREMHG
jgi:hypothetical protein